MKEFALEHPYLTIIVVAIVADMVADIFRSIFRKKKGVKPTVV